MMESNHPNYWDKKLMKVQSVKNREKGDRVELWQGKTWCISQNLLIGQQTTVK